MKRRDVTSSRDVCIPRRVRCCHHSECTAIVKMKIRPSHGWQNEYGGGWGHEGCGDGQERHQTHPSIEPGTMAAGGPCRKAKYSLSEGQEVLGIPGKHQIS